MNGFEGSFLGQDDRIDEHTVLECGVCWSTYDPSKGDPIWQIPAGTAFTDLPDHWRCPHCDAAREQFMVLTRSGTLSEARETATTRSPLSTQHAQLLEATESVATRMQSLPVYRGDLPIGVLGPRPCDAGALALIYTPWSMNLVLIADEAERLVEGSERDVPLPSGNYPFVRGELQGFGPVENCSLFSPMEDFEDADAVIAVAREAFREVFVDPDAMAHESMPIEETLENPSRRSLFTGRGAPA